MIIFFCGYSRLLFLVADVMFDSVILSFKNGSLTRERIKDECAGGSWEVFSAALRDTPIGNKGHIGEASCVLLSSSFHLFSPLLSPFLSSFSALLLPLFLSSLLTLICFPSFFHFYFLSSTSLSSPPSYQLLGVFPGFYFDIMEITPPAMGVYRFDKDDTEVG